MSNADVKALVGEIKAGLSQCSASQKDEVKVMQAMLNDKNFNVGVYNAEGRVDDFNPAKEVRQMLTSVIASTTKIGKDEASVLAEDHEFTKAEASSMVAVSKEFVNTYLQTGRKLPLGGRETSNIALIGKECEASTTRYPKKVGVDANGNAVYESAEKAVPAYTSARVSGPCPAWVK